MNVKLQNRGEGWTSTHGYKYVGKRGEHRALMESIVGRQLSYNEVVHHIDGNKKNNSLENLQIMDRGEHISLHTKGKTNEQRKLEKERYGYVLAGKP
jgi:hypothetical protein